MNQLFCYIFACLRLMARVFLDSRMVVPLNFWILISNFKLTYCMLRRPDGSFNRALGEFHDRKTTSNTYPVDGVFSFDQLLQHTTSLLCRVYRMASVGGPLEFLDLYRPLGNEVVPVVVFFHGGSFVHSSSNTTIYDVLCRGLVHYCNVVVISVDYRRAPEHRYPGAYDDGLAALRWVHSQPWLRSGKDSKAHVYLMGDSSGGNIAHHVAVRAAESGLEITGNILVNPMFGGMERTEPELTMDGRYFVSVADRDWYWRAFLPVGVDRNHVACNPFGPNAIDLKGLKFPRSLVVASELDILSEWQLRYHQGLEKADKDVQLVYMKEATVGFYLLPDSNHYFQLMEAINNFVRPSVL